MEDPSSISLLQSTSSDEANIECQTIEETKIIAHKLYHKYIEIESEFELNISATLRQRYDTLDNDNWNMEIHEMVKVFDDIIDEMFLLMLQSHFRFEAST